MTDPTDPADPTTPPPRRKGVMKEVFAKLTTSAVDGLKNTKEMPRAELTVTIDHLACAPGVFEEDFELTLRSTTPADELRIARANKGDAAAYNFALARSCIWKLNGELIDRAEAEVLWNALDAKGRNIVVLAWTQLAAPSDESLGKALGSMKIGG